MGDNDPIERYDQLPETLRNKIADLGPPTFVQIATLMGLGGLASAITQYIPNQRADRIAVFVAELGRRLNALDADTNLLESEVSAGRAAERARLLRDAVTFAEKAVSDERAARIARIASVGLAGDELRAQRARTFLGVLESLTDIELAILVFFQIAPSQRGAEAWRPLAEQLESSPTLKSIFENDAAYWVACVSKLEASGLLEGATVWGGEFEGKRTQADIDVMMHRVDLYTLTTVGRELVALVEAAR
ncbi:MAG: hypothetical protein WAU68_15725 [Vitreimonas sp.]